MAGVPSRRFRPHIWAMHPTAEGAYLLLAWLMMSGGASADYDSSLD